MSHINWLHLSDWHQRIGKEFDRKLIAKRLVEDVASRAAIDPLLKEIDFIVFSGDIAFSGEKDEFELANEQLIDPVRKIIGEARGVTGQEVSIYCVPGNHDIQRSQFKNIPPKMAKGLRDHAEIEKLLQDDLAVRHVNKPLSNFYTFARKCHSDFADDKLYFVKRFKKDDFEIGIACLNTAWLSGRSKIEPRSPQKKNEVWDRGVLCTSEAQINDALDALRGTNIAIAIMHHPLHWLEETEQAKAEQAIGSHCHIVLHGHEHRPNMNRLSNAFGDVVVIPAGASYNRRNPDDPRYTNAYNFCSIDLDNNVGTIFHRVWSEDTKIGWRADERFWADGKSQFFIQKKQAPEQEKIARRALDQLSKSFLEHIYKRPAAFHKIEMRHEAETIDGELFIRAHFSIKIELYKGEAERFPIRSLVNQRIVSHPNPKVSKAAHKLIKLHPNPSDFVWNSDHVRWEGYLDLGPNDQDVEYDFEMLETTDGLYYFNLRRFTEKVEFNLIRAPELEYEDLPFGGFPSLESTNNKVLRLETWKTKKKEPAMPNQGLVLQWYLKPRVEVAMSGASSDK
jgi:predicted phosphodiesterase